MLQRRSIALVVVIAAIAAALSVASIQYYSFTAGQIVETGRRDVRNNAQIEANAISHSLSDRIENVRGNLQMLSTAPSVLDGNPRAQQLFDAAQETTSELTDGYYWLDRDGRVVTYSGLNSGKYPDYRGDDLSFRDYYQVPKQTLKPFWGTVVDSRDGVPRMYVSMPILGGPQQSQQQQQQAATATATGQNGTTTATATATAGGQFEGVVVAAISSENAGQFMQGQLLPQYRSNIGLMDKNGLILYSTNKTLIGTHYYDAPLQSILPPPIKAQFNSLLAKSIEGESGMQDISYAGNTSTIAYEPVMVGNDRLWTAYVVYPHVLEKETLSLLYQQRLFNVLVIAAIVAVATPVIMLVLTSNRRLQLLVEKRTSELRSAVDSLARANEQLKEHDKLQREFINIAAHELRTPIQPVVALADMLLSEYNGGKDTIEVPKEQMEIIDRNAKRLQKLSSDILDVTRIEGGRLVLDKVVVDINEKVRNVLADAPSWVPNGAHLQISFHPATADQGKQQQEQDGRGEEKPPPLYVEGDRTRLYEVLANLLRNAIRFSGPDGAIEVSTERRGDQAVVKIKDRGPGIEPAMMGRLFTKFSTGSEKSGTGLGLFIAKSIVEAHGGRIWAQNNADGQGGATFTFTLPLARQAPPQSPPATVQGGEGINSSGGRGSSAQP